MRNILFLITTLYVAVQGYLVLDRQLTTLTAGPQETLAASPERPATSSEEICATGCSVGNHPITPLTAEELTRLFDAFANAQGEDRESALETLLFHGAQVRARFDELSAVALSPDQDAFLSRELAKTHARVWMRIVDEHDAVRASVEGHRFPIGKKEHVHVEMTDNLPAPEISGTVHRTGLYHLWTRI